MAKKAEAKKAEAKKAEAKTTNKDAVKTAMGLNANLAGDVIIMSPGKLQTLIKMHPINIRCKGDLLFNIRPETFKTLFGNADIAETKKLLEKPDKKGFTLLPHKSLYNRLDAGKGKTLSFDCLPDEIEAIKKAITIS